MAGKESGIQPSRLSCVQGSKPELVLLKQFGASCVDHRGKAAENYELKTGGCAHHEKMSDFKNRFAGSVCFGAHHGIGGL
ncbi:MAG: hypothetical protein LBU43_02170 [Candidatus Accumulibacter sp.]|jgi:hypothetical protein|nr:hypothetical protein [Accumulibacter sp.]